MTLKHKGDFHGSALSSREVAGFALREIVHEPGVNIPPSIRTTAPILDLFFAAPSLNGVSKKLWSASLLAYHSSRRARRTRISFTLARIVSRSNLRRKGMSACASIFDWMSQFVFTVDY